MDPREANLPRWAQEMIKKLRDRLDISRDPLVTEVAKLRPQVELLKTRNEALIELLECAARGQHKTAAEIMEIIRAYNLTLTPNE